MAATNNQIIGFGGRLQSGKSLFAKICEEHGYTRLYFALPLKKMICNLLSISLEELLEMKTASFEFKFQDKDVQFVANETNIPFQIIKEKVGEKVFHNTRELMQIIGTDLIRNYNMNWHVNKIKEIILNHENDKFVIDDVRFENECDLIKEMNGTLWFIVRPNNLSVSHHSSEETLHWYDFENVIVNNMPLAYLRYNWEIFLEGDYERNLEKRHSVLEKLRNDPQELKSVIQSEGRFNIIDLLFISKDELTYDNKYQKANFEKLNEDDLRVLVPDFNALMIEDLKVWL